MAKWRQDAVSAAQAVVNKSTMSLQNCMMKTDSLCADYLP
jgi:hypothetical protein